MDKVAIVFGSTGGSTEDAAKAIAGKLGKENADVINVSGLSNSVLEKYNNIILGTSTWGDGDLQDDWEEYIAELSNANLEGKTVALFGLGDAEGYPDTFVDGIGILYNLIKDSGCTIVGLVDTGGYSFSGSQAVVDDKFVGLPLDDDNESDKTADRISNWVDQIKTQFN